MKRPDDVIIFLKNKFKNKHKQWLREIIFENADEDSFPMEINLNVPTEQDAVKNPEGVRSWISSWKDWQNTEDGISLIRSERRWRSLGKQNVPEKLILSSPEDAAFLIGEASRWNLAAARYKLMIQRWSSLIDVLPKYYNILADYNDSNFKNLCEILSWICANPNSNLYIRQIPVSGIDSKWLESRKGLVSDLINAILTANRNEQPDTENDFFKLCGLKRTPQLIRIRILDPKLRKIFGGLGDISAPLDEISCLDFTSHNAPLTIFIIENIQTALAFDDLENTIVLFGLGYGVDVLGKIPWLQNTQCFYWGDIDTHGFAILNRARSYLPNIESVLMDEQTLLSYKELWVEEKEQFVSAELPNLTETEQKVFLSLKNNIWGKNVRLEQERICWETACNALKLYH